MRSCTVPQPCIAEPALKKCAWKYILMMHYSTALLSCVRSVENTEILGYKVPYYHLFNGLLVLLVIMHAYWCAHVHSLPFLDRSFCSTTCWCCWSSCTPTGECAALKQSRNPRQVFSFQCPLPLPVPVVQQAHFCGHIT